MNSHSVTKLLALVLLAAVMNPRTEAKLRRECSCDLRYDQTKRQLGDSVTDLPVLTDLDNYDREGDCSNLYRGCWKECEKCAGKWLNSTDIQFNDQSGPTACNRIQLDAPPKARIYVYITYELSGCGSRNWQKTIELCCRETTFNSPQIQKQYHFIEGCILG